MIKLGEIVSQFPDRPRFQKLFELENLCKEAFKHGDADKWKELLSALPQTTGVQSDLNSKAVSISFENESAFAGQDLRNILMGFHPWRKGPFELFGNYIDTEWRSDLKWERVKDKITPLDGRTVLDVGCGNGYHCWRMLGAGASNVIGLEPYLLSVFQFQVFKKYLPIAPVWILPLKLEQFTANFEQFDTVFSMGVLYHQRSPFDHFAKLKSALKSGGELVIETLVVDGIDGEVFVPESRYAKMRNVWFIPSTGTLSRWLKRAGFKRIELIDVTKTTRQEQRKTEWMTYESLDDFLDPKNENLTVEGCPAPLRAIFKAEK